jgi:hypothetical protein
MGTDPLLDRPNRLFLVQAGFHLIAVHYPNRFRVTLRVPSKYFSLYQFLFPNLSPLLLPFLLGFPARSGPFLGRICVHYMPSKPIVGRPNDRYVISTFVFHPLL